MSKTRAGAVSPRVIIIQYFDNAAASFRFKKHTNVSPFALFVTPLAGYPKWHLVLTWRIWIPLPFPEPYFINKEGGVIRPPPPPPPPPSSYRCDRTHPSSARAAGRLSRTRTPIHNHRPTGVSSPARGDVPDLIRSLPSADGGYGGDWYSGPRIVER